MGQVRFLPVIYGQKNFSPHQESNLLEIDFSSLILQTGEKSVFKTVVFLKNRQPDSLRISGQQVNSVPSTVRGPQTPGHGQ